MLGRINDIHVAFQITSLTLCILLWNLPLSASSCTASFELLSPDFWLHLSFPSESLNLYILVASLDEQDAIHSDYKLHWQNMLQCHSQPGCAISWESPSVMTSLTNDNVWVPKSTWRASWNHQRNNQDLSFGAKHLTTTITFPPEPLTESVSKGLLSLFISLSHRCKELPERR